MSRLIGLADRAQQRRAWAAYPYAVIKKFTDDQAGNLAAQLAYYAFLSIFPLLLLLTTVLAYLLGGDSRLQERILHSALVDFPVIGDQLRTHTLHGHWYVLVISAAISLWGARGVASAAQTAFNTVWNVPYARRPGFLAGVGRSFGLLAVMALSALVTGLLSGIGGADDPLGILLRTAVFLLSAAVNVGVFLLGFRLATAREVKLRSMVPGAVASAILWQALLAAGTFLVAHQVTHQKDLYGTFGVVLGLLAWLHLQAQLTLWAVEADVVRAHDLWPRSLTRPPLTTGDQRAYRDYAETARRLPTGEQDVDVRFRALEEGADGSDALPRQPVPAAEPVGEPGQGSNG